MAISRAVVVCVTGVICQTPTCMRRANPGPKCEVCDPEAARQRAELARQYELDAAQEAALEAAQARRAASVAGGVLGGAGFAYAPNRPDRERRTADEVPDTCEIARCSRPYLAKGMCRKHYLRWYKYGDPHANFGRRRVDAAERQAAA